MNRLGKCGQAVVTGSVQAPCEVDALILSKTKWRLHRLDNRRHQATLISTCSGFVSHPRRFDGLA